MVWIPIGVWIGAAVVAIGVLGYCAYQISWRARRLQRDVAALSGLATDLAELSGDVATAQRRVAALELG